MKRTHLPSNFRLSILESTLLPFLILSDTLKIQMITKMSFMVKIFPRACLSPPVVCGQNYTSLIVFCCYYFTSSIGQPFFYSSHTNQCLIASNYCSFLVILQIHFMIAHLYSCFLFICSIRETIFCFLPFLKIQ